MARRSLRPHLNQIRGWVRQGRTDAWIAHQLEVTVQQIEAFKRENDLAPAEAEDGDVPAVDYDDEIDLRAQDDELIAAELEEAEARRAEEEAARAAAEEEAARLAAELAARRPDDAGAPVALHGDVHPKNGLLLPDGRIALIDLDQCGLGPAAVDLGSLVAGLRYRALIGGDGVPAAALERALLDGYAARRSLPAPVVLRWHVAAALLSERALRAVNRIRPEGLEHLEDVLRAARAALAGAQP
jgi:Ser/Thr protein kinase RdoA (MazF antagonist)